MNQGRKLFAGVAALGFSLGYLAGLSPGTGTEPGSSSSSGDHHANSAYSATHTTKLRPRNSATDAIPNPEKDFSRRIVDMMSKGELNVEYVGIMDADLQPGFKVQQFLNLSDEKFETMKQIGRKHLQQRQDHEQSIGTVLSRTPYEIEFDLPADPAFAAREKESFLKSLRDEFGPDVAAILQASISQSYGDFEYPRHIYYNVGPPMMPSMADMPNAPTEFRQRPVRWTVNHNRDDSVMTDLLGAPLPGAKKSGGIGMVDPDDTTPDFPIPRYHYLWQRPQKN